MNLVLLHISLHVSLMKYLTKYRYVCKNDATFWRELQPCSRIAARRRRRRAETRLIKVQIKPGATERWTIRRCSREKECKRYNNVKLCTYLLCRCFWQCMGRPNAVDTFSVGHRLGLDFAESG